MTRGLPQKDALETVLRDSMAADSLAPAGIYFGTRSGKLYASHDDGRSWQLIHDGLPAIVCVKTAVVGEEAAHMPRKRGTAAPKKHAGRSTVRTPAKKNAARRKSR